MQSTEQKLKICGREKLNCPEPHVKARKGLSYLYLHHIACLGQMEFILAGVGIGIALFVSRINVMKIIVANSKFPVLTELLPLS